MTRTEQPRILLVDSYDSFTHNLVSLFQRAVPDSAIHIVKNDALSATKLLPLLDHFSAVVVGPGPGSPENPKDIGFVRSLWKEQETNIVPVFGVCLGLQSLAVECGGKIKRLHVVKHGQISKVSHDGVEIFKGVGDVYAVRYHSLHVDLDGASDLEALGWTDDGEENRRVIMALKHRSRPFWAVQYHPESVCTRGGGEEVIRNFWRLARNWSTINRRSVQPWDAMAEKVFGPTWPTLYFVRNLPPAQASQHLVANFSTLELPGVKVADLCEMLGANHESSDFVLLDSAAKPGRFAIIGCIHSTSPVFTYWAGDRQIHIRSRLTSTVEELGSRDVWGWLAGYMRARKARGGPANVPFWGGLIGFLSYELGVEELSPSHGPSLRRHPDVNLVYVDRSIVVDILSEKVYVQTLRPADDAWLSDTVNLLRDGMNGRHAASPLSQQQSECEISRPTMPAVVTLPDRENYISAIKDAQDYLASGDSYELCLTGPTRISVPKAGVGSKSDSSSWSLYKNVRARNPAPHSGYLRLHPSTLVSSSPERFLSYTRPPHSVCQLRPIKGTLRKGPSITREVAEEVLAGNVKEIAENLMIVDLIRHDLHGVVGPNVEVKQFCQLEEYETVWQLVSVIEGSLQSESVLPQGANLGWEVLRRSLPPGSMTGAPKKRSVEILRLLEGADRGIYSGVFGYWDVGGGGDWSVTIRSCFKFDPTYGLTEVPFFSTSGQDEQDMPSTDEWVLGAGGAITALSDPQAEWEEMITKVESVLRGFGDVQVASTTPASTS